MQNANKIAPHINWPNRLLLWFEHNQRQMPWRSNPLPYWVWISEIMLQQTQVATVIPYFIRFIQHFPTVETLAKADLQEVLKIWEGLGYYSRARNLHKAAKLVIADYQGTLPNNYTSLQQIPGIGPYVAAAIASIAFSEPVPVVDGNVLRVFSRFWGIETDIIKPQARKELFERLRLFISTKTASNFNQAIMELGALVCSPKSPKCNECPLQIECVAHTHNRISELPIKTKKAPTPHYHIAAAVIWKEGKVLIGKRKANQLLGGLWEFPGGKQKPGESLEQTAIRETLEETGLNIAIRTPIATIKHAYTHFKITLSAFNAEYISGTEVPKSCDELRWITPEELRQFPFPKANKTIITHLLSATPSLTSTH